MSNHDVCDAVFDAAHDARTLLATQHWALLSELHFIMSGLGEDRTDNKQDDVTQKWDYNQPPWGYISDDHDGMFQFHNIGLVLLTCYDQILIMQA